MKVCVYETGQYGFTRQINNLGVAGFKSRQLVRFTRG